VPLPPVIVSYGLIFRPLTLDSSTGFFRALGPIRERYLRSREKSAFRARTEGVCELTPAEREEMNIKYEGESHDVVDNKGSIFLSHDVNDGQGFV